MNEVLAPELAFACARLGWRDGPEPGNRCAVTGYDGSPASMAALAYASGWAQRNHAGLVVVHVDNGLETTIFGCACAMAAVPIPDIPPHDLSADVHAEMTDVLTPWAYLTVRGDIADRLEYIANALKADVIIVGKTASSRITMMRPSVGRRLIAATRHIVVVV